MRMCRCAGRAVTCRCLRRRMAARPERAVRRLKRISSSVQSVNTCIVCGFISRLEYDINFGRGGARRRRERCCTATLQRCELGVTRASDEITRLQPMQRCSEKLNADSCCAERRFCVALGAMASPWHMQPQRQARAQIHRTQPRAALGGPPVRLCCRLTLWLGSTPSQNEAVIVSYPPPLCPTESRSNPCSIETTLSCPLLAEAKSCASIGSRQATKWHHKHYCTTQLQHAHDLQRPVRRRRGGVRARTRYGAASGRRRGARQTNGRAATSTPGTRYLRIASSRSATSTRPASTSRNASANAKLN